MSATIEQFEEMKGFLSFGEADAANLQRLAPVFATHGAKITDDFYAILARYPTTAALIETRLESLKATHNRWMSQLFEGSYGAEYFENRIRIGLAHVRIGLPPWYVEAVMNLIRIEGHLAIVEGVPDADERAPLYASLLKILDLDLMIINLTYSEERLDRVTSFTGMSRKLIENVINQAKN
ncbi:MAG TPA: hypothetical protein ENK18_06245 [Deltaproteobacteria bacterium]|nr:hypothetical protein [Deltaproteobacteria bacterium]